MKKITTCLALFFTSGLLFGQHIEFNRENTQIVIGKEHVNLSAELVYKNNSGQAANQMMFFPLCVRSEEMKRDSFAIFDVTSNIQVPFRKQPAGVFYMINFQPYQQKKIRITCRDDHNGSMIKYLIMTHIKYWGLPLDQGDYVVKYDQKAITIDSTSYKPDQSTVNPDGESILSWRRTRFMPEKELEVYFTVSKP